MLELIPMFMFLAVFAVLISGYSVALSLAGVALLFAIAGNFFGIFDIQDLGFIPGRLFGIITNQTLIAVPLFVLMGVVLEKTEIAGRLLRSLSALMGHLPGGLALAVIIVGMLMAASTGIVGATVVTMGLLSLPTMLEQRYDHRFATGTIAATGTLGQLIPPSIALVLLGDVMSNAYQRAQLEQGIFVPDTVSVGDLFAGALVPGLILVGLYLAYVMCTSSYWPSRAPRRELDQVKPSLRRLASDAFAPLLLIILVLGSILGGYATPTEAAGVGAAGSILLAWTSNRLDRRVIKEASQTTVNTTAMVFFIIIGASIFSLVFRGYGGDELVHSWFEHMPGGIWGAFSIVMLAIFLLGFVLDFIEITFLVVPIVGPILLGLGIDPIWLGVMIAVNLQTSFLTPPFGFALFYLRGVAPNSISTQDIYRGVVPYIGLQLLLIGMLVAWPNLATWLPELIKG
ncbi:MAG: C4-dicarboxylate ABC transporter [Gammaproteobacteria bacterium]|nr:C4-dicarboxylate ABC transporter [Gammaproteobacteria bacterium]